MFSFACFFCLFFGEVGVRGTFYRFLFHVINIRIYASLLAHGTIDEKRNQCFLTLKQYLNKNKLINFFSLKGDGRQQKNKQRNCSTKKVRDAGSTKSYIPLFKHNGTTQIFLPGFWIQSKILLDLHLLQTQWIADLSILVFADCKFGSWISMFCVVFVMAETLHGLLIAFLSNSYNPVQGNDKKN